MVDAFQQSTVEAAVPKPQKQLKPKGSPLAPPNSGKYLKPPFLQMQSLTDDYRECLAAGAITDLELQPYDFLQSQGGLRNPGDALSVSLERLGLARGTGQNRRV